MSYSPTIHIKTENKMAFTQFEDAIKTYLDGVAEKDELFAKSYNNPKKNIKECCTYLMNEAKKAAKNGSIACKDEEIYGLAMHYYDEEDIEVGDTSVDVKVVHTPDSKLVITPKKGKGKRKKDVVLEDMNDEYELEIPMF